MWELLKSIGLTNANKVDFMAPRDEHVGSLLKLYGLCSGEFCHVVKTDGVSICFHFQVPKVVSDMGNRLLKKVEQVSAIDPGGTNLVFGGRTNQWGGKNLKLTPGKHCTSAGMKTANRKATMWEADLAETEFTFQQTSPKTIQEEVWDRFLAYYTSVFTILWDEKTA